MIFVDKRTYAKVWKVERAENGKYIDLQITTSEKDSGGNYKNSRWFPRCIGKSVNTLKDLKEGDRIEIERFKLTNESYEDDEGKKRSRFRFLILEAEISGAAPRTEESVKQEKSAAPSPAAKEETPW